MRKIIFLNTLKAQCGVYEYGRMTSFALRLYLKEDGETTYANHESHASVYYEDKIDKEKPDIIIVNYHPLTMPLFQPRSHHKYLIIRHDEEVRFKGNNIFSVNPDPLFIENGNNYKVGRFLVDATLSNEVFEGRVGTLGFGMGDKAYNNVIDILNNTEGIKQFLLHVPNNDFVDNEGVHANKTIDLFKQRLNPNIELMLSRNYLDIRQLIHLFSTCQANIFIYDPKRPSSGCSSAADIALSTKRPLAINESIMFRHVLNETHECSLDKFSLRNIMDKGTDHFKNIYDNWTMRNVANDYERIINIATGNK